MENVYLVSRNNVIYMEGNKIQWIHQMKGKEERKEILEHLKEYGSNIKLV